MSCVDLFHVEKLGLDADASATPLPADVAWVGVPSGLQALPKLRDSCRCCPMRLTSSLSLGDPHPRPCPQSLGLSQQEAQTGAWLRDDEWFRGASGHRGSPGPVGTQWG